MQLVMGNAVTLYNLLSHWQLGKWIVCWLDIAYFSLFYTIQEIALRRLAVFK